MNPETQLKSFKDLAVKLPETSGMEGPKIDINKLFGREIIVHRHTIGPSKYPEKGAECLTLQISLDGTKRVVFSGSKYLIEICKKIPIESFPFKTTIIKADNDSHQFT